ncbi:MAG TPA: glycosyl hydrolase [Blastocatellia bacterium]|nr:glycosyl hydrolase [Blastocatellia bacterium]
MMLKQLALLLLLAVGVQAQTIDQVRSNFQRPPDDAKVMMRWWWFGPSVAREQLELEMRRMKEGGIGGFEVQPVYPLSLDDPAHNFKNFKYLSPEFLESIGFTARKARELGLRMDLTLGSGWPYGGPFISLDLASGRLRSEPIAIMPNAVTVARPAPYEGEQLIAAFVALGIPSEIDTSTFRELSLDGKGAIALPPGNGPRTVVFYFSSHTRQAVKRAAYGAEGFVLDHYSRKPIETFLREAGDKLMAAAGPGTIHAIFCDSLEVYEADWTADLLQEFRKRRGYELRPLLPLLEYNAGERSENVRRDFGRTLSELYEERFLGPMREWTKKNKVLFRIQNYGIPPATLASSRHADLLEGEGWQWRSLTSTRWASSAGHIYGKKVISSETWTWLHSPAFRATPLDIKAEADLHFLMGINQLIGHGWPYSPPQAGTPGWSFYAAGVYNDRNPWWPVMPDLAGYLQRVSYLLREGEPVADVALYLPTEDVWSSFRPGTPNTLNLFRKSGDLIGPNIIPAILDAGLSFDLIDDGTLAAAGSRYKAIILPGVRSMPEATNRWLAEYAGKGGTVLAVRRKPEQSGPSLELVEESGLTRRLASAQVPDVKLSQPAPEIGFIHRRTPDSEIYFLANTGNTPRRVNARFRTQWPQAESWDPFSGKSERLEVRDGEIALSFDPYGSRIIVFSKEAGTAPPARTGSVVATEELRSGWSVSLGGQGAGKTVELPHSWAQDPATSYFSGAAAYRRKVELPAEFRGSGTRVYLDFGEAKPAEREPRPGGRPWAANSFAALVAPPIGEAATIWVNDRRAGSIWAPPYRVEITDLLRDGTNEIKIEVYNTAINQLAEAGRLPDYKALVERYGLRFRMQDMDGLKPLPSGILAPVRVVAER